MNSDVRCSSNPSNLSLHKLTKRFGAFTAVRDVSVDFSSEHLTGLVGPNGAGKTTLFGLIDGHHMPTTGTVQLNGLNVTHLSVRRRAIAGMSRTFQTARSFPGLTVAENLLLARRNMEGDSRRHWWESKEKVLNRESEWLRQLASSVHLDSFLWNIAGTLTQPNRKRLDFAMALASDSKFLILDEPTAGIGQSDVQVIRALLHDLKSNRPEMGIIISSHDIDLVLMLATRLVVMVGGELVADGSPSDVMSDSGVQRTYLGIGGAA
jgi:branched-chain amino acid transport system ATP-binding protein